MSTSPAEPERPTRPALSREFILRTALRIVDDEGPDKLTMRHLGAVLGVDPMAVYHYLPNKAALFDGIVETIWSFIGPASIPTEGGWRQRVAGAMHSFRDVLRQHPRAVAILGTRPIATPELLTSLDRLLGTLVQAGMPAGEDAADLLQALVVYTIGQVLAEVGEPIGGASAGTLDERITPDTHPHLAAILAGANWTYDPDRQYDRGLSALLSGWGA